MFMRLPVFMLVLVNLSLHVKSQKLLVDGQVHLGDGS